MVCQRSGGGGGAGAGAGAIGAGRGGSGTISYAAPACPAESTVESAVRVGGGAGVRWVRAGFGTGDASSSAGLADNRTLVVAGGATLVPMAAVPAGAGSGPTFATRAAAGAADSTGSAGSRAGACPSHATTPSAAMAAAPRTNGRNDGRGFRFATAAGTVAAACAASTFAALGDADAVTLVRDRRGRPCIIDEGEASWTLRYRARLSAARQGLHSMAPGMVEWPQIVHFMLESHRTGSAAETRCLAAALPSPHLCQCHRADCNRRTR